MKRNGLTLTEALTLCTHGHRVRPECWRTLNPRCWVQTLPTPALDPGYIFVECGELQEIPHALRLQFPTELLGEWEVYE